MQALAGQKFTKVALCGLVALAFAATVSQAQDSATPSASATPSIAATAAAGAIRGTIQASGVPLPGVAVTAVSPGNGTKYTTTTDVDGLFQMAVPAGARYSLSAELAGFALVTKEITVPPSASAASSPTVADFSMDLASRVPQSGTESATAASSAAPGGAPVSSTAGATVSSTAGARGGSQNSVPSHAVAAARSGAGARGTVARVGRGSQTIQMENNLDAGQLDASVGQANSGVEMPSLGGVAGDEDTSSLGSDTVAVSGQQGQTNGLAGFSEGDIRQRIDDMRREGAGNGDIAGALMGAMAGGGLGGPGEPGGPGGPGGGGGRGGPGGGGGGGRGGRGGGFGGGGGGFGRGFRQNSNAWHGSFAYNGSDSALNATPFSVTGRPVAKPASDTNSLVGSVAGSPFIPGLTKPNPKQFVFLTVNETRNTVPTISQAVVPTAAQRLGDLTGQGNVYDPSTGQPYGASGCSPALLAIIPSPTACVPDNELNPAAQALLNYYPLPNIVPIGTNDNFQTVTTSRRHSSQVSARYNRSFGAQPQRGRFGGFGGGGFGRGGGNGQNRNAPPTLRQSIAANFAYSHQAASTQSFVPALGGNTESNGYNVSGSYTVGYGRLNSTATLGWNRSNSLGANYFTNGLINPAVAAGINVANPIIYGDPFYFGVPSVGLTGFSGLGEATTPSNTINQTITASDSVGWSHKRHNMRFGLDFHRIHLDSIGGTNVLGSFTFSGFATESPTEQACNGCTPTTGSSLADLLIGHPQQTQITAGLNKIYLRGNSWDWYAQDDWRARSNLTFLYAVRWEYFSPYSEKNGRLVNLALSGSGNGLQIQNVCATAAVGCELVSSGTLVAPDKAMYSPRIGLAWSPKSRFTKNTVVRAGYGINYNTGQYATFARKLAFQQPFAVTQTNTLASGANPNTGCTLANMTLANGFNCSAQVVQSNYGVDPNYRLGMVQIYNLGIQRTLPQGIVLNIDYNGTYAGNLDMLRAPNRTPTGVLNQAVTQFTYEDSLGYQRSNGLAINLRERMHKGIALGATYTYSHSIDDASSIGGSGNSIAQDDQHLDYEESNSTFDRRHVLNGNYVIELPFGPNRALLNKGGVWSHVLDGFSASGNFTFASGSWATPVYSGTANEVASGSGASLRPNRVAGQPIAGAGTLRSWFNKNAFTTPVDANGNITYGNAGRNSIEMPGTVSANGSLSRTFSFGETRSLETRITASNVFNTVQYSTVDTTLNSPTFGQVVGVQGMRAFTYTARYRF